MAKKQSFLSKTQKKNEGIHCPVCDVEIKYVKHVKAVRGNNGSWKFRSVNTAVCKCNEKEIYV